jgi:sporulation protein YlmC with PRC-barrel domain
LTGFSDTCLFVTALLFCLVAIALLLLISWAARISGFWVHLFADFWRGERAFKTCCLDLSYALHILQLVPRTLKGNSMSYLENDQYGMYARTKTNGDGDGPGPRLMGAETLLGNDVYNKQDEDLGDIKEIMLDVPNGKISYAVLSYGGVLGFGEKLFAVPWDALKLDTVNKRFVLDIDKERLAEAPGFDKDDWPDMADQTWQGQVHSYYGTTLRNENRL